MTLNRKKCIWIISEIVIMMLLVCLDRITKYLAVEKLKDKPDVKIIEGVFELHYLENRGAAFGMFQNQKLMFIIIAFIMMVAVFYILVKVPEHKKYMLLRACMLLIGAGAVGNLIDRLANGFVVDFLYFVLIDFPVFNVADIYVTVSCILLIIIVLFFYKEEDLKFLKLWNNSDLQ